MTDTEAPPTDPPLGYHQGAPVVGATIQITNTGAGLDKGLAMAPVELQGGQTYDVVLRCRVVEHRHDPLDEEWTEVQLVNRLKAEHATIVGAGDVASEALDKAEARVAERRSEEERRKREEAGELELDFGDGSSNGEPQKVGEVLDDVIDLAEGAEEDWRAARADELGAMEKAELASHLESLGCADVGTMKKAELVAEIIEWEEADRG